MKKRLLGLVAALGFSAAASAGVYTFNPQPVTVPVGGSLTFQVLFAGAGTDESQFDFNIDTTNLTIDQPTVLVPGSVCSTTIPGIAFRIVPPSGAGTPLPSTPTAYCSFRIAAAANATVGPRAITPVLTECTGSSSTDPTCTHNGTIAVVLEGPPTITFNTAAIALPGGAYGATVSAPVPASIANGGGNNPANTASFSCTATAGFTVAPTSGGPFQNGASLPAITVSATLGAAVQNGTVNCTATNTSGSSVPFAIPVSAPAGAQTLPNLASSPASGSTITLPAGLPGSTVSSNITITPSGGVGVTPATVTCSAVAPVTVNPTTQMSFLPGTTTPQNVAVQCLLLEDVEQNGTVTCTGASGAGQFTWNYNVVCPAGVNTPAIVPATSAWSKFALIALFAGLGLLMVGFRRQH